MRVLIVDDRALVRRGLAKLLEIEDAVEVVGEAADGTAALGLVPSARPDVALVDARMPRMDGVELVRRLSEEHPRVAAIILTTFDDEYIFGGLRAGAHGYLLKDTSPEELVSAIEKAHRGETVLGGQIAARVVAELGRTSGPQTPGDPAAELPQRETEVVALVGSGATNAEIARALYISEGTARNHVSKILRKLGLRDRTQLAIYAVEQGRSERYWTEHREGSHSEPPL